MGRAQRGAYTWWKGLNSVKTGPKWAKNTCLSIPNGPGSLLEKHVFNSFLTNFCSQNGHFSRHFGILHWRKRVPTGSKRTKNTCLSIISGLGSLSPRFGPFLVSGCWCTSRGVWGFLAPFWAVSRTCRGVRGHQRSLGHEKVKPHVECSSRLPSFGCFEPLLGLFLGEKWPFLAQNCADLGGHLRT